jgi:hypothetical protein
MCVFPPVVDGNMVRITNDAAVGRVLLHRLLYTGKTSRIHRSRRMANTIPPLSQLLRQLAPDSSAVPDSELLRRYADQRDEAAFELLLWRRGRSAD